jgi:chromosome segregation ATPase
MVTYRNSKKQNFYIFIFVLVVIAIVSIPFIYRGIKKSDNFSLVKNLKERFRLADEGTISTYEDLARAEKDYKKDLKSEGDSYNTSKIETDAKVSKMTTDYSSVNSLISKIVSTQSSLTADIGSFDSMIVNVSSTADSLLKKSKELQTKASSILSDVNSALSLITPLQNTAAEAKTSADTTLVKANAYALTVSEGSKILSAFQSLQQYIDTDKSVKGAISLVADAKKALDEGKVEKGDVSIITNSITRVNSSIEKITSILKNITALLEVGQDIKDLSKKQVDDINAIIADISSKTKLLLDFKSTADSNLTMINARISDLNLTTNMFTSNIEVDKNYSDLDAFYKSISGTA